jgi:hypothetical protein
MPPMTDQVAALPGPAASRLARPRRVARRLVEAALWLVLAVVLSLGAAGLVAGVGGPPGSTARPELTWQGDAAMRPGLDAATTDLRALAGDVDGLGTTARTAIAALVATDRSLLSSSIDQGTEQLATIRSATDALRVRLNGIPGADPAFASGLPPTAELTLSGATRERYSGLRAALDATGDLPGDWATFTSVSLAALDLTTLILDHDTSTAAAATQGRSGDYAGALKTLDTSDGLMARAQALRDRLAPTTDVTTLTTWLDRDATYDRALRTLYAALRDSKGIVTEAVRAAFAAEQSARDALPPDTRGLVVILGDVARGGLNQAAIAIETARGQLDAALAAMQPGAAAPGD